MAARKRGGSKRGGAVKRGIKLVRMEFKAAKKNVKAVAKLAKTMGKKGAKNLPKLVNKAKALIVAKVKDAKKSAAAARKRLSKDERVRELAAWNGMIVTVGIHGSDGATLEEGGLTLAQIMTVHEFGSDDGTIPQRSWLRAWFDESQGMIEGLIKGIGTQVAQGNLKAAVGAKRLGALLAGSIQRRWAKHPWAPLSEGMLKRNPNRVANSALTDTGQSRAAVSFQVRTADGELISKGGR
jgi:hypothetical protein